MTDTSKPHIQELSCASCGKLFIISNDEKEFFDMRGFSQPKHCKLCRMDAKELRKQEQELAEKEQWEKKRIEDKKVFEARLKEWDVIEKDDIHFSNNRVLYVIGNGFDLMHGVKSSYYAFRDTMGKSNTLRFILENFIRIDDVWADLEIALAYFDKNPMIVSSNINDWLDIAGAYDKDAGIAEIYVASEWAASPIVTVADDLPRRFRRWIEMLSVGTDDRPLKNIFTPGGKILCFNYTEFAETLYGFPEDNICYVHGCRGKKKYAPEGKLILGHTPGVYIDEEDYDYDDNLLGWVKDSERLAMIDEAQDNTIRIVAESDATLTKNCKDIIQKHDDFFVGLEKIENVVTVGHSLSPVDWDYYFEIVSRVHNIQDVQWYFGCHGRRDLDNLEKLITRLELDQSKVHIFRTDGILVEPLRNGDLPKEIKTPVEKQLCVSEDDRWLVKTLGYTFMIVNQENDLVNYKTIFSSWVNKAFFVSSGEYLFSVIHGVNKGVFLFRKTDNQWSFVKELEGFQNFGVINRRLQCVYVTKQDITFVYNNRVRKYSLVDGSLLVNKGLRNAPNCKYEGEDISKLFIGR